MSVPRLHFASSLPPVISNAAITAAFAIGQHTFYPIGTPVLDPVVSALQCILPTEIQAEDLPLGALTRRLWIGIVGVLDNSGGVSQVFYPPCAGTVRFYRGGLTGLEVATLPYNGGPVATGTTNDGRGANIAACLWNESNTTATAPYEVGGNSTIKTALPVIDRWLQVNCDGWGYLSSVALKGYDLIVDCDAIKLDLDWAYFTNPPDADGYLLAFYLAVLSQPTP